MNIYQIPTKSTSIRVIDQIKSRNWVPGLQDKTSWFDRTS